MLTVLRVKMEKMVLRRWCEKDWVDGPALGRVDGRGYLAWCSEQASYFHTSLPEPPEVAFQGTQVPLHYRWENKCLCESRLKVAFSSFIPFRKSSSTLPSLQLRNNTWLLKKDLESFSNLVL